MATAAGLEYLDGHPSSCVIAKADERAKAAAELAAASYTSFSQLFRGVEPVVALVVTDEADWSGGMP